MILYKFKSLHKIEHVFDILHNQRLFCTKYTSLNDPFEGLFLTTFQVPPFFPGFIKEHKYKQVQQVSDLYGKLEHRKICSLSRHFSDVRLWSHYADGHRGIAIAIDFFNIESDVHEVVYSAELPEFGHTLLTEPIPAEVLSRKTDHWKYEKEYRIVQDQDYFPISGRIKAIFTGQRISDFHLELLKKITPEGISIYATKLNTEKVLIEEDKLTKAERSSSILK